MIKTKIAAMLITGLGLLGVEAEDIKARVKTVTSDSVTFEVLNPENGSPVVAGLGFFFGSHNCNYRNLCPKSTLYPGQYARFTIGINGPRNCDEYSPEGWLIQPDTDYWCIVSALNDSFNVSDVVYFHTLP